MKRLAILILVGAAVWFGPTTQDSRAERPTYLLLRAPARTSNGHAYYPGDGREVKTQRYAYGWFGARPRKTWTRHFGYYSNYTQWSKR